MRHIARFGVYAAIVTLLAFGFASATAHAVDVAELFQKNEDVKARLEKAAVLLQGGGDPSGYASDRFALDVLDALTDEVDAQHQAGLVSRRAWTKRRLYLAKKRVDLALIVRRGAKKQDALARKQILTLVDYLEGASDAAQNP